MGSWAGRGSHQEIWEPAGLGISSSPALCPQKLTWRSNPSDIDVCRMKGKQEVSRSLASPRLGPAPAPPGVFLRLHPRLGHHVATPPDHPGQPKVVPYTTTPLFRPNPPGHAQGRCSSFPQVRNSFPSWSASEPGHAPKGLPSWPRPQP